MMRNGMHEMNIHVKKWDHKVKDQTYEGEFLGDSFHGQGAYKWNKRDVYEGGFFSNHKEGYAILSFPNNSSFEGLFIRNQPFGPGILTHANGRQDAGFWVGQKLVRLSRPVDFIVPRLAPNSAAKIKLLQFRRLITLNENNCDSATLILKKHGCPLNYPPPYSDYIYDPRSIFFNKPIFEKTFFMSKNNLLENLLNTGNFEEREGLIRRSTLSDEEEENSKKNSQPNVDPHCICQDTFVMKYEENEESDDICTQSTESTDNQLGLLSYYSKYGVLDDTENEGIERKEEFPEKMASFKGSEIDIDEEKDEDNSLPTQIVSWNRSELCTEMLKQIFRHRAFEEKLNFKIAKLMLGVRTEFRRTGVKEKECLQFLKMCTLGPPYVVKDLLYQFEISEELMDSRGNNSLMFAAATDQHEIIDILLDYGVDVNTFNDEGLTPLNLCLLRRLAQANNVCNWETTFLPKEIEKNLENNLKTDEWKDTESIESLDRIFGDGMSADSSTDFSTKSELEGFMNESEGHVSINPTTAGLVTLKLVPKSNRRDEFEKSVKRSNENKYLFDLSPEPKPVEIVKKKDVSRSRNTKNLKEVESVEEEEEEEESEKREIDPNLLEKLRQIDKTIEKLLNRGADPNISEVPKPSIHLAVFTKDINVVHTLLHYGASPNCQMYPNEGLLTPLHVVALLKASPENVDICRILLNYGANPEDETSPDFSIYEGEKEFLDNLRGRTPLQLLCMRPDLEYADPKGYVTEIALMLAKVSNKDHFYKGHSFLTLAMLTGNIKLLSALLNYFDPNECLEGDLGTALHVLVSTQFQKKTNYESSVKMCDLLLAAQADPLKVCKTPTKLIGTCVDYGYQEIDLEKTTRRGSGADKKESKSSKQEKAGARDHLRDHIKVLEYLEKKVFDFKRAISSDELQVESKNPTGSDGSKEVFDENEKRNSNGQKGSEVKIFDQDENSGRLRNENRNIGADLDGNKGKLTKETAPKSFDRNEDPVENARNETEPRTYDQNGNSKESRKENVFVFASWNTDQPRNIWNRRNEKEFHGFDQYGNPEKPREENKLKHLDETEKPRKRKMKNHLKSFDKNKIMEDGEITERERRKKKRDRRSTDSVPVDFPKNGKKKQNKEISEEKIPLNKSKPDKTNKPHKTSKSELFGIVKNDSSNEGRKGSLRIFKSFSSTKYPFSERFPEKLRQSMLSVFGNSVTIDVNELLLPYVVLRDGDLYYRFHGRWPLKKEQYSLI